VYRTLARTGIALIKIATSSELCTWFLSPACIGVVLNCPSGYDDGIGRKMQVNLVEKAGIIGFAPSLRGRTMERLFSQPQIALSQHPFCLRHPGSNFLRSRQMPTDIEIRRDDRFLSVVDLLHENILYRCLFFYGFPGPLVLFLVFFAFLHESVSLHLCIEMTALNIQRLGGF
jgi:hypothetical protein